VSAKVPKMRWSNRTAIPVWALMLVSAPLATGQTPEAVGFFRQNCTSCHTIGGGRLTGPDLKNVTRQKDRA
jgi:cytochrome c2